MTVTPTARRSRPTLTRHPRTSFTTIMFRSLFWILSMVICYVSIVTYIVQAQSTIDETQDADAAIVLGAAMWAGTPSPVLRARLDHALTLYTDGTVKYIIVTGGVGYGDNMSEAEGGAAYLIDNGIPSSAILLETEGHSTYESLRGAVVIAANTTIRRVLIVSDPFHMLRSLKMARDLGFDAYASPTRTSPISTRPSEELLYMIREALAYSSYMFTRQ